MKVAPEPVNVKSQETVYQEIVKSSFYDNEVRIVFWAHRLGLTSKVEAFES